MATKSPTYLKFPGVETPAQYGYGYVNDAGVTGTTTVTTFVRLLEWPATVANIWLAGPLIDAAPSYHGVWFYNRNFANTAGRYGTAEWCLGASWGSNYGSLQTPVEWDTSSSVPLKLGVIYQIQWVMAYNSSDSQTYNALFVNGVSVYNTPGGWQLGTGGTVTPQFNLGGGQAFLNSTYYELPCMDIIQFKWEVDRTITYTGSVMDAPDSLLDPWEELSLDGSCDSTKSVAYFLDEGTGNVTVSEGTGQNSLLTITENWADPDKVDPYETTPGTAVWSFENIYGYPFEDADDPELTIQPVFAPVGSRSDATAGELRLKTLPTLWREMGDMDASSSSPQWNIATAGLTRQSTAQVAVGNESILGGIASANNARTTPYTFGGSSGAGDGRWYKAWFYDKGGSTSQILQRLTLFSGGSLSISVGCQGGTSTTNYVTFVSSASTPVQTSSVSRSTGWHEFAIYWEYSGSGIGNDTVRIYIDGALDRTETGITVLAGTGNVGMRTRASAADEQGHYDWMSYTGHSSNNPSDFDGFVLPTGTLVLPTLQPDNVSSFDSVTIDKEDAGTNSQEVGTTTITFRHSDDGGTGWTTAAALTTANLAALTPAGGGLDIIEITVQQDSGMDDMSSPALRSITLNYTSGIIPRIVHHRNQMAGACC